MHIFTKTILKGETILSFEVIEVWGKYDVLCIGSATVDNYLFVEKPFSSLKLGDKALVKSVVVHSGGGATNSAVALSRFGLKVKVLSKLGKDHDAKFIQRELLEHRIENLCIHHSKKHTDVSTILEFSKNRDRIILTHKGASTNLSFEDVPTARLSCRWIYLATLMGKSLATAKQLATLAQKKNIPLLFNP
ncbi:MAG: carbohydrate kinase family protein, partial [Nanoarchaeota archaeon]